MNVLKGSLELVCVNAIHTGHEVHSLCKLIRCYIVKIVAKQVKQCVDVSVTDLLCMVIAECPDKPVGFRQRVAAQTGFCNVGLPLLEVCNELGSRHHVPCAHHDVALCIADCIVFI